MTWVAACITPEAGGRSTDFYHKILEYQKTCRGGRDNVYLFVTGRCVSKGGTPRGVFTLRAYFGENGRRALRENHLESVETLRFHFDNYDDLPAREDPLRPRDLRQPPKASTTPSGVPASCGSNSEGRLAF